MNNDNLKLAKLGENLIT